MLPPPHKFLFIKMLERTTEGKCFKILYERKHNFNPCLGYQRKQRFFFFIFEINKHCSLGPYWEFSSIRFLNVPPVFWWLKGLTIFLATRFTSVSLTSKWILLRSGKKGVPGWVRSKLIQLLFWVQGIDTRVVKVFNDYQQDVAELLRSKLLPAQGFHLGINIFIWKRN